MTLRIAVVDGTGPETGYAEAMKHSFCQQIATALPASQVSYQRGPTTLGLEVFDLAYNAADWLERESKMVGASRLMLAGYSRGGSAVIMAAQLLQMRGLDVEAMFLFDAVARHAFPGGEIIPANVKFSRHARRSQSPSFVMRYEGTISDGRDIQMSNPCRPSFGNTGLQWWGNGDHEKARSFTGSHGALGGVGWPFVVEDVGCQQQVADFMNTYLAAKGVNVTLKSVPPSGSRTMPQVSGLAYAAGAVVNTGLLANHAKNLLLGGRKYIP